MSTGDCYYPAIIADLLEACEQARLAGDFDKAARFIIAVIEVKQFEIYRNQCLARTGAAA
jgi:hypothetical protein